MRRILVTGGAGFVGSTVALYLKNKYQDNEIIALDNLSRKGSELNVERLQAESIHFVKEDVRNWEFLDTLEHIDIIIECSADPSVLAGTSGDMIPLMETNYMGAVNCLELAKKHGSDFVFISTSRIYPFDKLNSYEYQVIQNRFVSDECTMVDEDFPLDGIRSFYGLSKLSAEFLCQEYAYKFGIRYIINRCGVLAGPWQMGKADQGLLAFWMMRHVFNKSLSYIGFGGDGHQVRDFLDVRDFCSLLDNQITQIESINNDVFNVGGGIERAISLKELTCLCEKISSNKLDIGKDELTRYADIKSYISDNSKVEKTYSWQQKYSLEQTAYDTYDWIINNKTILENKLI